MPYFRAVCRLKASLYTLEPTAFDKIMNGDICDADTPYIKAYFLSFALSKYIKFTVCPETFTLGICGPFNVEGFLRKLGSFTIPADRFRSDRVPIKFFPMVHAHFCSVEKAACPFANIVNNALRNRAQNNAAILESQHAIKRRRRGKRWSGRQERSNKDESSEVSEKMLRS